MKYKIIGLIIAGALSSWGAALPEAEKFVMDRSVMSKKYWEQWNDDAQKKIDADIEKYRKADASIVLDIPDGTAVKVDQISSAFYFGAHIFNFNQLGKTEWNNRYKELYGTLFNSATVSFYWKTLEPYQGKVRFAEAYEDTEDFWNACAHPEDQPHWRRPAVDPVISFLKTRGCRIHGHPLSWGNNGYQTPTWVWDEFCPKEEKEALYEATGVKMPEHDWHNPMGVKEFDRDTWYSTGPRSWSQKWKDVFKKLSEEEVAAICPTYFANLNRFTFDHIREVCAKYGTRVDSWDVCNESAGDFNGKSNTGKPFQRTDRFGVQASDLAYNAFKIAGECLPTNAWLNINDYATDEKYVNQIEDLCSLGCKIDVMGSQMHLFNPAESVKIARGEGPAHLTPKGVADRFAFFAKTGKPIHLSEITITAPDNSERGQMVQAIIMWNLYRAWFSVEKMTGITWWNVVDNCGAPGEPSISGLFTRDMRPKTAYYAMNELVNHRWRTHLTAKAKDGKVSFRGFRGKYRLTWKTPEGKPMSKIVTL